MIEIVIDRQRTEVDRAIVEFVARRSYNMTNPWYIEGLRIEAPRFAGWRLEAEGIANQLDLNIQRPHKHSWWESLLDLPQVPRIEIEIRRRRGRTVVKVKISNQPDSTKLAAELQTHLLDDRAYDAHCPSTCRACGAPIASVLARYCGRCGQQLLPTKADAPRLSRAATAMKSPPALTVPERSPPPMEATPPASSTTAAEPLAADDEMEAEPDSVDANEPDAEASAAPSAVAESESPPVDEPIRKAMAEADDDAEPPRRALAED